GIKSAYYTYVIVHCENRVNRLSCNQIERILTKELGIKSSYYTILLFLIFPHLQDECYVLFYNRFSASQIQSDETEKGTLQAGKKVY
ncbi:hypothetical protein L9F63_012429, partial [Diploptera punctata]